MASLPFPSDPAALRSFWGWLLALGIVSVILGMLALGAPFVVTVGAMVVYGCLLIGSGAINIVGAFWTRNWGGFFLALLMGVLALVVGIFLVDRPVEAAVEITLLLAIFLVVGGAFRMGAALALRFPNWGWTFVSGLIALLLGVLVWRRWPYDATWFIGMCVGVDLIVTGWSWVMLALMARSSLPRPS